MSTFTATVPSTWTLSETFEYLADFRHVQEWDPGIDEVRLTTGQPARPGSRYELTLSVAGTSTDLCYEAMEVEAPRRIVMRAETDALVSLDTITLDTDENGRVHVTYEAELELKGVRKLAQPVAGVGLHREGEKAAEGLRERLARPRAA
jgi:hypothetical protein